MASSAKFSTGEQNELHSSIKSDEISSCDPIHGNPSETRLAAIMNIETPIDRDTPSVRKHLEQMPTEIITFILEYLGPYDRGSLRLASRLFAAIGRRLLCGSIFVMDTTQSFERLLTIASQNEEITRSVQHLIYIPLKPHSAHSLYSEVTFTETRRRCGYPFTEKSLEAIAWSWNNYTKFWGGRKFLLEDSSMSLIYLEKAFRTLRPNSIFIDSDTTYPGRQRHKLYKQLCDHEIKGNCLSGNHTMPFVVVLLAAEATGLRIRELTAAPSLVFLSHPMLAKLTKAFESIEILTLVLSEDRKEYDTLPWNIDESNVSLAQFLQHAQNLRRLDISQRDLNLGKHCLSKLESLTIHESFCRLDDLIGFILIHAKTLKVLTLSEVVTEDSWVVALELLLHNIRDGILVLEAFTIEERGLTQMIIQLTPSTNISLTAHQYGECWYDWPELCWNSKTTAQTLGMVLGKYVDEAKTWAETWTVDSSGTFVRRDDLSEEE